uniref:Uncharacterized protein AlNc14C285G10164 n=1 Tax=Albugo laibachii Nc14 TaxID=890382 RepID=F0WV18_9STRA|nr:conserved hypothetical protein [Albugo laibachii Nc14]|eukprot:CCA25255.1 conserved hypothetical protein [Albugo laibachii Nc14]
MIATVFMFCMSLLRHVYHTAMKLCFHAVPQRSCSPLNWHGGLLESDHEQVFVTRAQESVQFIQIISAMSFAYKNTGSINRTRIFLSAFQHSHTIHTIKRPGIKKDGLAVLVDKQNLDIQFVNTIRAGDRVAMHLK